MINLDDVKKAFCIISSCSSEAAEEFSVIIENAVSFVQDIIRDESSQSDSKVIFLAAAKANYDLALIQGEKDGITSFSAGDISISKSSSSAENAKLLFENAKSDCAALISDNGFVFRGV